MHSVRSRARHMAWRQDGDSKNYNPFARTRSRTGDRMVPDVENQPMRNENHSENCLPSRIERDQQQGNYEEPSQPKHASTMPASATSERAPGFPEESGKESERTDATLINNDGVTNGVPRKRKGLAKLFGRANTDQLEKQPTGASSKSKRLNKKLPVGGQIKAVLFGSWVNVLLVAVPVGFAVYYAKVEGTAVFVINFIAIIPLAAVLGYATEELALRVGETLGGLLNASFGNAVELIISIQALIKNEITIVKTSLIGSMLSNLLLVLGMCFFLGGLQRTEQFFNVTVAQTAASLLALCIGSLIIPTVFYEWSPIGQTNEAETKAEELSHGTAIILLVVYGCYLIFQLKSHSDMYMETGKKVEKRKTAKKEEGETILALSRIGAGTAATAGGQVNQSNLVHEEEEEEEEEPQLTMLGALITLAISTTLVAFCSEFMVDSINAITGDGHGAVSKTFVGLILLPIVGNAAEHATAVTVAIKDKMDLAIGVAVGSSMQIALLVLPLVVILGWIIGHSCMTLYFDGFQLAVLFVSVLLVNYLIQDGKSHWLEGVLLISTYIIIAVAGWFYPNSGSEGTDTNRCSGL